MGYGEENNLLQSVHPQDKKHRCLLFSVLGQRLASTRLCQRPRARELTPGLSQGHLARIEVFLISLREASGVVLSVKASLCSLKHCAVTVISRDVNIRFLKHSQLD